MKHSIAEYGAIQIRLTSTVRVHWHTAQRRWYISDDGTSWTALRRSVRNAQTAIEHACAYYGIHADNQG
jgi:hypothetical protein